MEEEFSIDINYKGKEEEYPAQLIAQGYSYKFKVVVDATDVYFEPDEEGQYRAIKMPWQEIADLEKIDKQLLRLLQEKLEEILR